jgi:hypothetical protein
MDTTDILEQNIIAANVKLENLNIPTSLFTFIYT